MSKARYLMLGGFLGGEALEIIPAAIVFGRVLLTKIPAIGRVGGLGRRTIAGFGTAVAVAQAHTHRLALGPEAFFFLDGRLRSDDALDFFLLLVRKRMSRERKRWCEKDS